MEIRQSDLAAYGRCAQQKKLYGDAEQGLAPRPANLSRTVYGTVMHHALHVMERMHAAGDPAALQTASATFAHYWMPENLPDLAAEHPELVHGIDEWLPRDTYGGLRQRGLKALNDYHEQLLVDDGVLLALEVHFRVPIDLDEVGQHYLVGTADRLAIRKYLRKPYLSVEDFKTGKAPTYLRYNAQFTAYSWATTQREFWEPWEEQADERWQAYSGWARRGRWIDMRENKVKDAGWRGEVDYARLKVALKEYVKANEANSFPLTMTGETCLYCPFKKGTCGGVAVPDEEYGKPGAKA